MKNSLFSLVAVLALAAAGMAWASQPAASAPEAPEPAFEAAPASGESGLGEAAALEGLSPEPVEMCCRANCFAEYEACLSTCGGDPVCGQGCSDARQACVQGC